MDDDSLLPIQSSSPAIMPSLNVCRKKTTNVEMDAKTDLLTINNFSSNNHLKMVKVHKSKSENTIKLDIISANCYNAFALRRKHQADRLDKAGEIRESIFRFSLQRQFDYLLNSRSSDGIDGVNAIHGIRVMAFFWILLVHITTFLSYVSYNKKYIENIDDNWLMFFIFRNGSFSIDSYFFISGVFLCQSFFNSTRDLKIHKVTGVFDQFLHYFALNIFKILKLLLPYVTVLNLLSISQKHFNEHSVVDIPSNDHYTCAVNMWKNLIFLDNFSSYSERVSDLTLLSFHNTNLFLHSACFGRGTFRWKYNSSLSHHSC